MALVFSGADVMCATGDPTYSTPYLLAQRAGQKLQMEFLHQNKLCGKQLCYCLLSLWSIRKARFRCAYSFCFINEGNGSCTRKLFRGQCSTQLRCQGNRKNNSCILLAELKKKEKKRKKLTRSHKSVKRPLNQVCKLDFYNHQHHIYSAPIPSTLTSQSCLKPILTAVPPRS